MLKKNDTEYFLQQPITNIWFRKMNSFTRRSLLSNRGGLLAISYCNSRIGIGIINYREIESCTGPALNCLALYESRVPLATRFQLKLIDFCADQSASTCTTMRDSSMYGRPRLYLYPSICQKVIQPWMLHAEFRRKTPPSGDHFAVASNIAAHERFNIILHYTLYAYNGAPYKTNIEFYALFIPVISLIFMRSEISQTIRFIIRPFAHGKQNKCCFKSRIIALKTAIFSSNASKPKHNVELLCSVLF